MFRGNFGNLTGLGGAGIDAPFVGAPSMPTGDTARPAAFSAYRDVSVIGSSNYLGKDWSFIPGTFTVPAQLSGQVTRYAISSFVLRAPSDMPFLASGLTTLSFQGWDGTAWITLWTASSTGALGETIAVSGLTNVPYYAHQIVINGDGTTPVAIAFLQMSAAGLGVLSVPPAQPPAPLLPPPVTVFSLLLQPAAFAISGQPLAQYHRTVGLSLAPANYGISGQRVSLAVHSPLFTLTSASYAVSGQPVALTYMRALRTLALTPASYAVSGTALDLVATKQRAVTVVPANYALSGQSAWRAIGRKMPLLSRNYVISSQPAALTYLLGETAAWVTAVVSAGGTVSAGRKTLLNSLIAGLKSDGVWSQLDRLWLFAAENSQSALIDLVARDQASAISSPTFTVDRGYVSDGITSYVDTTFNPNAQGINYVQNNAHLAVWSNTNAAADSAVGAGVSDSTATTELFIYQTIVSPTGVGYSIQDTVGIGAAANSTSQGCFYVERNGTTEQVFYNNASLLGSRTSTASGVANRTVYACGLNNNGSVYGLTTYQISMVGLGAALGSTAMAKYYARLRTYMTAVGVS